MEYLEGISQGEEPKKEDGEVQLDSGNYCADAAEIIFKRYSGRSDRADDRGVKCSVSVVGGTVGLLLDEKVSA